MELAIVVLHLTLLLGAMATYQATMDIGRAKARINAEELLKLHRKRRDDPEDKLFSINSPRKNEQVRFFGIIFRDFPNFSDFFLDFFE